MKKLLFLFLFFLCVGTINAADLTSNTCPGTGCVVYNVGGQGSIAIQVTGTWSGTITFQSSVDNTNYTSFRMVSAADTSSAGVTTTTGNGIFNGTITGINQIRVNMTSYVSGTASITIRTTTTAARFSGGGIPLNGDAGTPSAIVLTNGTGLPCSTGVLSVYGCRIATSTLGSDQASISFTSIPATYSNLRLICQGRLTEATTDDYILIQFNNDTGSNYDMQQFRAINATVTSAATIGTTSIRAGDWTAASATTAGQVSMSDIIIANYANTTFNKVFYSSSFGIWGTTTSLINIASFAGQWRSTAAINRVDILATANNLKTGTTCQLYGLT